MPPRQGTAWTPGRTRTRGSPPRPPARRASSTHVSPQIFTVTRGMRLPRVPTRPRPSDSAYDEVGSTVSPRIDVSERSLPAIAPGARCAPVPSPAGRRTAFAGTRSPPRPRRRRGGGSVWGRVRSGTAVSGRHAHLLPSGVGTARDPAPASRARGWRSLGDARSRCTADPGPGHPPAASAAAARAGRPRKAARGRGR